MGSRTVQPRQPTREGQALKREDERIRQRVEAALLDGRLTDLESIAATSSKEFKHGLGRKPVGYFLVRFKASGAVSEPLREVDLTEHVVELRNDSAIAVEAQLWVF